MILMLHNPREALLALPGVTRVDVEEGKKPYLVAFSVWGGSKHQIAKTINDTLPAPYGTIGNHQVTIECASGRPRNIYFCHVS